MDILAESIAAMEADLMPEERAKADAPTKPAVATVAEVFDRLAADFDPARAEGTDLIVQFALTGDEGGTWVLTIRDRALSVDTASEERDDVTLTIRAAAADYLRVVNGDLSGVDAFTTQRLTIDGDLDQAAALGALGLM